MVNAEDAKIQGMAIKDLFSKLATVEDKAPVQSNTVLSESSSKKPPASTGLVADPMIKNILSKFNTMMFDSVDTVRPGVKPQTLMENTKVTPTRQLVMKNALDLQEIKTFYKEHSDGALWNDKQRLKTICQMAIAYLSLSKSGE